MKKPVDSDVILEDLCESVCKTQTQNQVGG